MYQMIKRILSQLHRYVILAMISFIFWAWIFTLLTDTVPAKKIVLYSDAPVFDDQGLAAELENDLPKGIRMIQAHPFSYAMFDTSEPLSADLYILSESDIGILLDQLNPIPYEQDGFVSEGTLYGILLHDAEGSFSRLDSYSMYATPEKQDEDYYLCFNKDSLHLGSWNGSEDDAALKIAERILTIP